MKPKKLLFTLITSTVVLSGGVLVACGSKSENSGKAGPETGVYYNYDAVGGTGRSLTLSKGNKAALELDGTNLSGSYTVKNGALKLKLKGQKDIDATLDSDVITFTYNSEELKFWKDIDYTVTYETYGGTAVSQTNVKYGAYVVAPNSPTRGADAFIGWTTVANGNTLYSFDVPVTGDITLHAKWVQATDHEFALKFDLGYNGAAQLPSTKTVANRAYNLPTPTRSGYTFKGWWVSQYDSADKLSYRCNVGETEFGTDTTLYAKWQKEGEVNPDINITGSGISWEGTGSAVTLVVKGPEGYGNNGASEDKYGATGAQNKAIDFAKVPAGDYEITLESGGQSYKLYYKNKAVYAVSGLKVVNNNELQFAAVDGAEKYYIDIDCGTPGHNHNQIDNGNKTTYDFSACDMKPEGITFTVYASASGKATSVGRSINHEAHLAPVDTNSYKLDGETGVLTWTAVENAQNYAVSINGGKAQTIKTNSISINNYDGEVKVSVVPLGHGYNAGAATEYKYKRTSLSTPKNLRIEGTTLKWTGDTNAKEYEIKVGTVTLKTSATELDLSDKVEWQQDQEYDIIIRSLGDTAAKTSYWSNTTEVTYSSTTSPTPKYSASTVSWAYTLGVDYYEVQVNDGQVVRVDENSLSNIVLTKKGANTIKLRSVADGTPNEWKTVQVNAYQIAFETGEGVAISNYYKAVGDNTNLPTPERVGYDFSHWSTAAENGSVYDQETFTGESDIKLYAAYTPRKYTVNLNYGSHGAAPDQNSATVQVEYDSDDYKLPVPTITDGKMLFVGWNTSSLGNGVVYTDYSGAAATAWQNANDGYILYAVYVEAFSFTDDVDGYMVSAGREIAKVSHVVIPDTYNGKQVRSLNENAFKNCKSIVSVSIPSTVKAIPETAFTDCTNLKRYESYVSALEPVATYYATADGILLRNNPINGAVDLMFIPKYDEDKFRVPNGVTNLRSEVFKGLAVSEIIVPASVRTIENSAFKGCNSLTKVTFEDGAESLTMNIGAFNGCANITELVLPGRLASMGTNSEVVTWLQGFRYLKKITVEGGDNSTAYASDENGLLFNGAKDTLIFCPRACELTEYVVPSTVLHIADGAFAAVKVNGDWESRKLTSITFHNQMRSIGAQAFYRNSKLKTVTFASSATRGELLTIGEEAFYYCTGITTLDFQETGALNAQNVYVATATCGVAEIGNSAFSSVRATSVTLPSTLTSIGNNAFSSNSMLETLDLGHVKTDLTFGDSVFAGNTKLTGVEITPNIGVIEFQNVFRGCNIKEFDVSNNSNYEVDNVTNAQGEVTGCVIYDKDYTKIIYINNVDMSTYKLPSKLTVISGGLFRGRDDIVKFTVPAAVTSIGANAFQNCVNLEEIIFEDGTANLTIGTYAFSGCSKLTEITIPSRTTSMGASLFTGTGLQTITFEEGVTAIPVRIFDSVTTLKTVNLPSTLSTVGEYAFYGSGVETVTFAPPKNGATPVSLEIKDHAFAGCASLISIVLPEGLQCVSESMFENCAALESVTIPTTVKNTSASAGIGKSAFYNCGELTDIIFTEGGTDGVSFGEFSLCNTMKLTTIDLPTRAAAVGNSTNVFALSTKTNSSGALIAPNQIGAFDDPIATSSYSPKSALQTIKMGGQANGNGTYFSTYDGVLYSANHETLLLCPKDYDKETLEVSKYAKTFGIGAFRGVTAVKHIVFQAANDLYDDDGETRLPEFYISNADNGEHSVDKTKQAFYDCKSVESIAFPARLTSIGAYAFWKIASANNNEYSYLQSVTFATGDKDKPVTIGEGAFMYSGITSLVMPNNLTTIGARAFQGSSRLSSVTWSSKLAIIESGSGGAFEDTGLSGALNLPESLTKIGKYAFRGLNITTVAISPNIELLGESAFEDTELTEVALNVTNLKADEIATPFKGCNSLANVYIGGTISSYSVVSNIISGALATLKVKYQSVGDGVTYLPNEDGKTYTLIACSEGYNTDELVIPANVSVISAGVFADQTGIKAITFEDSDVLLTIEAGAFNNTGISSIDLSARKLYNNEFKASAFTNNHSLTEAILPVSLSTLSASAFEGCENLKTVSFMGGAGENDAPSLTTIGNNAFKGCTALKGTSITEFVLPRSVTTLGEGAFSGCTSLVRFVYTENKLTTVGNSAFYNCTGLRFIGTVKVGEINTDVFGLPTTVTTIGISAFENCSNLGKYKQASDEYVNTEESLIREKDDNNAAVNKVTSIGQYAFKGCTSLVYMYIPSTVGATSFGKGSGTFSATTDAQVFYGCTALKIVTFSTSSKITIIGKNTFYNCKRLKSVNIPNSVTTIGESAFQNCGNLLPTGDEGEVLSVSLGTGLQYIHKCAFKDSAIGSVTLPASFLYLGGTTTSEVTATADARVFEGCTRLTSVDMSNATLSNTKTKKYSVRYIGTYMFSGCTALTNVVFSAKTIEIGSFAFDNCLSLDSVTFSNASALTVDANAFYGCTSIERVNLRGTNGTTFKANAFAGCNQKIIIDCNITTAFKPVTIETNAFSSVEYGGAIVQSNGGLYVDDNNVKTLIGYVKTEDNTLYIDGDTGAIAESALSGNTVIEHVYIPTGVTTIGKNAFFGCTGLKSVTFGYVKEADADQPETVADAEAKTEISESMFQGCNALVYVDFTGVKSIGKYAFKQAGKLHGEKDDAENKESSKLTIPSTVTSIAANAFDSSAIVRLALNASYNPETLDDSANSWFTGCTSLQSVSIGAGVKQLGNDVFRDCTALTAVTFAEDSVVRLGYGVRLSTTMNGVFYGCTGLTAIALPNSLKYIGGDAFYGCSKLAAVDFGKANLYSIGYRAFTNCHADITFTKHEDNAVIDLTSYNGIVITRGNEKTLWTINNDAGYVQDNVFTVPDGITGIGDYLFCQNTALTKVVLTDDVIRIGDYAFNGCSNLTTISIKSAEGETECDLSKIQYFGSSAFNGDSKLDITINLGESVKEILGSAFYNCSLLKGTIKVGKVYLGSGGNQFRSTAITEAEFDVIDNYDTSNAANMFNGCKSLTKVKLGKNVKCIASSMFNGCTALGGDLYLDNVITVGTSAFEKCTSISSVVLKNATSIGTSAFASAPNIQVYFDGSKIESLASFTGTITIVGNATAASHYQRLHVVGLTDKPESWGNFGNSTATVDGVSVKLYTLIDWDASWPTPENTDGNTEA